MKKHQFVKTNCNCLRNATYFVCKYCGSIEYCAKHEIEALPLDMALCSSEEALEVPALDAFKGKLGGTFNCLSPDYETFKQSDTCQGPDC
ncbi:MAG: hypothetical protein LBN33_03855 [Desulfovibrio sp.]|jgi:hypothetical protein|nr:hypothetical protein [Desulfovibrio sp.]